MYWQICDDSLKILRTSFAALRSSLLTNMLLPPTILVQARAAASVANFVLYPKCSPFGSLGPGRSFDPVHVLPSSIISILALHSAREFLRLLDKKQSSSQHAFIGAEFAKVYFLICYYF